jgi:hypothetical protein
MAWSRGFLGALVRYGSCLAARLPFSASVLSTEAWLRVSCEELARLRPPCGWDSLARPTALGDLRLGAEPVYSSGIGEGWPKECSKETTEFANERLWESDVVLMDRLGLAVDLECGRTMST